MPVRARIPVITAKSLCLAAKITEVEVYRKPSPGVTDMATNYRMPRRIASNPSGVGGAGWPVSYGVGLL